MRNETLLFIIKTIAITLLIYNVSDYLFLRKYVASLISTLLSYIDVETPAYFSGGELMLGEYLFSKNCIALSILSVMVGLLLASRGKVKEKTLSIAAVFVCVSLLNVARLVLTYILLSRGVSFFWAHDVLANASAVVLAFLLFWMTDPLFPSFRKQVFSVLDDCEDWVRGLLARLHPKP